MRRRYFRLTGLNILANITAPLAGIFHGMGDRQSLARLLRLSMLSAIGIALLALLGIFAFPGGLFALLTSNSDIQTLASRLAPWLIPTLLFGAPAFIYGGFFLGLTAGKTLRNSMLSATLIVFLPLALLALQRQDVQLLWLAFILFMLARSTLLGWAGRRMLRAMPKASNPGARR